MPTIAELAHQVADDIERNGHGGGMHGGTISSDGGTCCVIVNPTLVSWADVKIDETLRIGVEPRNGEPRNVVAYFTDWLHDHLDIHGSVGNWSDTTPTEKVLAALRSIDDQTEIPIQEARRA